ncbi:MAG: DUF4080 domain-containing protein, partial [Defluviitaleaceae bacterium]|nr:DUF4080 domain-containing protein [Defluviitaleaceae bacterium]
EAGLQSFFQSALDASSRKTDLGRAEQNIRALLRAGNIHIHIDLIAGLPYETLADFKRGFDRAYALGAHTLQLGFLKLLHGSRLRQQADALGIQYNYAPPYEIQSSPWLSPQDLYTLKITENALQHTYNKGRFLHTLEYVLAVSGISPFALFNTIGQAAPNHATDLVDYAESVYGVCVKLPGVDAEILRDSMICDWMSMVRGNNTPPFLRRGGRGRALSGTAEQMLGRKIARGECAVLSSGVGVFVDSKDRNVVTGLYKLYFG